MLELTQMELEVQRGSVCEAGSFVIVLPARKSQPATSPSSRASGLRTHMQASELSFATATVHSLGIGCFHLGCGPSLNYSILKIAASAGTGAASI